MGSLGRDRVFAIAPREKLTLPSDLYGMNTLNYSAPERLDWQSATSS